MSRLPDDLFELEKTVGDFIEYWGFKKIHGRIWLHLFLSPTPLSTAQLMGRLDVSKGLMSIAMRELLSFDVIREDSVIEHGITLYRANPDITSVIAGVLAHRELPMLQKTRDMAEKIKSLKVHSDINTEKLHELLSMTKSAEFLLKSFLKFSGVNRRTQLAFDQVLDSVQVPKV